VPASVRAAVHTGLSEKRDSEMLQQGGDRERLLAVGRKFFKAFEKNGLKAIAEVSTPETAQIMAMFGTKAPGMAAAYGKIESMAETTDGDMPL
jgi:hypothetical protein